MGIRPGTDGNPDRIGRTCAVGAREELVDERGFFGRSEGFDREVIGGEWALGWRDDAPGLRRRRAEQLRRRHSLVLDRHS